MRRLVSCAVVLGVVASNGVVGQEGERRLLTVEDAFRVKDVSDAVVSPDGTQVAYLVSTYDLDDNDSATALWMVPVAGGEPRAMTPLDGEVGSPAFSPDGKWLSFLDTRGDDSKQQVWGLDLRGGEAQQLTKAEHGVGGYVWSPDASQMVLRIRDPAPERDEDLPAAPWVVDRLQFKQDYRHYLSRRRSHLYLLDLDSEAMRQLTSGDRDYTSARWSPDGTRIAFVSNHTEEPDANYNSDVWVLDVADPAAELVRVSTGEGPDSGPRWSPDGRSLTWNSITRPDVHNYALQHVTVGAPGAEPRVLTEAMDRNIRSLSYTADGASIRGILESNGSQDWVEVDVETGTVDTLWGGERRVVAHVALPDGAAIVTASSATAPAELWRVDPGGEASQLTDHNGPWLAEMKMGEVRQAATTGPDGTIVDSFYTFPPDAVEGDALPTILWIHGGPSAQDDWGWDYQRQLFAAHGYLVVQPNYRGSHGYGQEFAIGLWQDWGGPESMDSIAAVDHAIAQGWADGERLGVGGWSYGGITTNAIITRTDRFGAAISGAGAALWVASYGHDQYQRWYELELGLPWENRELWERISTYNDVAKITTPTLWVGGEKDWNVPIIHSEIMYQAMRRLGRETVLVVYPEQGHWGFPPVYEADLYYRFLGWYAKYLLGDDSLWPTRFGSKSSEGDTQ